MLGLVVVIALSWLILWLVSREHLTALGIRPTPERLKELSVGLLAMALFCVINLVGQSYFKEFSYVRNPDYGILEGINATWWTLKAALFEEFIFRGVLLYLLIKRMGVICSCLISAVAFGIYHWFSYEMFSRGLVPMVYVFLLTGASGWMFAYAFARTKSLYAPFGLHFGWIVMSIVVFSAGPLGNSLYVPDSDAVEMGGWAQLFFFLWQAAIIPGMITWYLIRKFAKPQIVSE